MPAKKHKPISPEDAAIAKVLMERNKDKNFVQRAYDPQQKSIQVKGESGRSTHLMGYDGQRVYPSVIERNGNLEYLGNGDPAWDYADSTGEFITAPTQGIAEMLAGYGYKHAAGMPAYKNGGSWVDKYKYSTGGSRPTNSIVDYLSEKGIAADKASRSNLAKQYGVSGYDYSANKNLELLSKLRDTEASGMPIAKGTGAIKDVPAPPASAWESWDQVRGRQDSLNTHASQEQRIIEARRGREGNYAIVDKKNSSMKVYDPSGKLLSEMEVGTGYDKGDAITKGTGKWETSRKTTGAGVYKLKNKGSGRDSYAKSYGANIFELENERGVQVATALHQIPNAAKDRYKAMGNDTKEDNRMSSGCVNCKKPDFEKKVAPYLGIGSEMFVLPEDDNNEFKIANGKAMLTGKNYDPNVMYSPKDLTPQPIRFRYDRSLSKDSQARQLAQGLADNKAKLMKDMKISNDDYNEIAGLVLGIAGQESDWGRSTKYKAKENNQGLVNTLKSVTGNDSVNSRGLTQIKFSAQNKDVQNLFKKYGLTPENLNKGENAAVATVIMLAYMKNNELPGLKGKMKNIAWQDALLYLNQGKKSEIVRGTATPDKNIYIQNVKKYAKKFALDQISKKETGGWVEKYK